MTDLVTIGLVALTTSLGHSYFDVPDTCTPILPAWAVPWSAGGLLPPPPPPPAGPILAGLAKNGRTPGDAIVGQRLESERVGPPRFYPLVGPAREWQLTYRFEIIGPDGPYVVYADRTALILVPPKGQ